MIRRSLGPTGMTISAVGLGAWAIGGWLWGEQDDADSLRAIHAAVDAGVDWIDTAPIYGSGRSERVVGEALRSLPGGHDSTSRLPAVQTGQQQLERIVGEAMRGLAPSRRPRVFTKFGLGDVSERRRQSATRAEIFAECEASLRRLGVTTIDLYQLHWPVPQPIAEVAAACAELLEAGKIRAVGVCNFDVPALEAWRATGAPLHSVQNPYSLFRPAAAETTLPWCAEQGLGFLAYSPLFRGMLFGAWTAEKAFPPGDSRGEHQDYRGARFARHLAAIEDMRAIAAADELTVPQLAIGYLLCTPGLTACIVGARNEDQGKALGELATPLTAKQLAAVDAVLARLRADLEAIPG